jgi:predicted dehydrogenase
MKKLNIGILGLGYIGASHVEAVRRLPMAHLAAVADANPDFAQARASELGELPVYDSLDAMLADESIDVIHNCTPNHLHAAINEQIIKAGKHLLSEKPLAINSNESAKLLQVLEKHDVAAAVNFNYRLNPMVQEMRCRIKRGDIGEVRLVHGSYLQDWLLYETDYNWRVEPEVCGSSRCIADIGSHWMDAVQTVTGARITAVCADLVTVIPVRKKPINQVETFAVSAGQYEEKAVETEDYGAVLIKMSNGASGVFHVSQVSAGHGCFLNFEINGSQASLAWNQEQNERLWMGFRDRDNICAMRDPNRISPQLRKHTRLAMGHPEGWNDAFTGNIRAFYQYVAKKYLERQAVTSEDILFATFEDAHNLILLTEAILRSSQTRAWVHLDC